MMESKPQGQYPLLVSMRRIRTIRQREAMLRDKKRIQVLEAQLVSFRAEVRSWHQWWQQQWQGFEDEERRPSEGVVYGGAHWPRKWQGQTDGDEEEKGAREIRTSPIEYSRWDHIGEDGDSNLAS